MLTLEKLSGTNHKLLKKWQGFTFKYLKSLSFKEKKCLIELYSGHFFRLYQTKYCSDWDKLLTYWLDMEVPMEVGKHDVRFIFADGNTVDVWKSNRWYSYANLYKINGESIDEKNRPSLETMWRFYELTEVNQRIVDEKRKAKQVALMKKFIK